MTTAEGVLQYKNHKVTTKVLKKECLWRLSVGPGECPQTFPTDNFTMDRLRLTQNVSPPNPIDYLTGPPISSFVAWERD